MSDFAQQIADLPPEKRELLEMLLREEGMDLTQSVILPQKRDAGPLPLSFAQQRLWFLDQLEPGSPLYNIPSAVRLSGKLEVGILQRCVGEVVRRHEVLRTTYRATAGQPYQVIAPHLTLEIPLIDLRDLHQAERQTKAIQLASEEARRPFDLAAGPLLRVTLLRLDEAEHIVLFTMHHIASDGWSMSVLIREIASLYAAFSAGEASPLPELTIQYADYAAWQQHWLQGEVLEEQLSYWKKQLGGSPLVLGFPADHPRPAIQSTRGDSRSFVLPASLGKRIQALSQEEGATMFMALLAAFQTLLFRYTGQEDISVGSPIANRNRAEVEGLIGFFANTLVLRSDLSGDPSFEELLQRVKQVTLGAYDHQDLPFEMLVDHLQADRDMSYTPLFQVMFSLQNATRHAQQLPTLTMSTLLTHSGTAKFDLTLVMVESPELDSQGVRLSGSLEYNSDLFEAATIERMLGHFQVLLEGILDHPESPISTLPLLTEAERHQLLVDFHTHKVAYPQEPCIHHWVEAQAERTPEAVAVTFDEQQFTYQELNRRASQLAHHLQKLGVGPDVLVGLFLERSLDMVVAILATLKAGGAYLPIDLSYPPDRQAFMLEDAHARVLLTQESLLSTFHFPLNTYHLLCLDRDWPAISQESAENLESGVTPENLAYVIYTSGSTGKPKGVMVTHANVVRLMTATEDWYHFNERDVWSLFHSYAFDFSVWEIWGALFYGGRLVVVPYMVSRSPEAFYRLLAEEKVTVLNQTPSAFRQLIRAEESVGMAKDLALRYVIFGGEALELQSLRPWYERHGDQHPQLVNMYGITETTVHVTYRPLSWEDLQCASGSVIGGPIPDLEVYILDQHLKPVPLGVPGELCVGGAGLARGYLNRPGLTAQKFVPNPFGDPEGRIQDAGNHSSVIVPRSEFLYRSGDLARYLPNGDIEYLGRIDLQVKIRGFRIELGEIEAVLGGHPAVRESVVLALQDGHRSAPSRDKRLVAFIVPAPGEAPTVTELRRQVQEKLPEYMVPSAFVLLEALPLTTNGKADRKALAAMPIEDQMHAELGSAYVAPRTPQEEILVGIWKQILKVERIGVEDNFFELGGHSLLATQLMSRLRDAFQVELPLRALFETPTVSGLAESVARAESTAGGLASQPIPPAPRDIELPLSFGQQRLWFLDQFEPGTPFYNIPSAVRLKGNLDVDALQLSLNEIVRRHESLRTTITTYNGHPIQVIADGIELPVPVVDLRNQPGPIRRTEAHRLAMEIARTPFDLQNGPLIRAQLLRLEEDEYIALLVMHHIVSDGWSGSVLVSEIAALYQAFAAGQPSPLPELPIQYADFAFWQREWLQGEVLEAQLGYWKRQLGGELPVLKLPTDRPRPAVQTSNGAHFVFELPEELASGLTVLSQQEGVTLFMTLLAAFQILLYRYTGQTDICVGTPIANRTHAELEGLIGFFVNTLALRTDLSGEPTFQELLARVREVALGAYAHQDMPFEMLVNELQPERDMGYSPLFQVMFVLQNIPQQAIALPGLTLSAMEVDTKVANFDLTLTLENREGGLGAAIEYNTDLFEPATIVRMAEHFQTLLRGILSQPEGLISRLPLLPQAERQQVLFEWNDTRADYSLDHCLHQLFEDQAARTPESIAATHRGRVLTYAELDRRANQLAHHLQALGVRPDTLVGISIERSLEMLVGLLGILKAGGAYVPLDPDLPRERLEFLKSDSGVKIILTQESLLPVEGSCKQVPRIGNQEAGAQLPDTQSLISHYLCLDTDWPLIAQESDENLALEVSPQNLAYVIYTSGSTGKPKGVMISHRSVVNHNLACVEAFRLQPGDRVLQFATINFDTAVEEIFPTWFSGATLVLRPEEVLSSGADMMRLIEKERLTVLDLPTAYWHEWVYELSLSRTPLPECLRLVIVGGEKALLERYTLWKQVGGARVRWLNTYGPTEGTIVAAVYDPEQDHTQENYDLPIGRPLPNTQLYVLDKDLQPVPIGVPGELHIGGVGVARGYLHRPDLTAEKFVPDSFVNPEFGIQNADYHSSFLYRTGDLARFRPDGNIEFLGRIDHQVKVRGFRVELGEIETALREHPDMREAVVVAMSNEADGGPASAGLQRLVAYVVPARSGAESAAALRPQSLRQYLKDRLPEYMVPSFFVTLDELPMTPSRKIDRQALPKLEGIRPELDSSFAAPRTPQEEALAKIWAEVLGLEKVGIHDNFFELGGDSILSIQAIARASQAGLRLTPRQLFEAQTVARLAAAASTTRAIQAEQGPVTGSLPLTPIQRWFFEQDFPDPQHWNQALLLEVRQTLHAAALKETLRYLLAHHDALRLRFEPDEAGWRAINAPVDDEVPFEWLDLSEMIPEEQTAAIEAGAARAQASLNLANGPLLRAIYFDLGVSNPGRLLLVIHHLAVDGVSWRILLEDFQNIYRQISLGKPVHLAPKTTSFRDWAHRLSAYANSNEIKAESDYWLELVSAGPSRLPVDFPQGSNLEASARSVTVTLSMEETRALLQEVPAAYHTEINDALLAALAQAVTQWAASPSLLVELEGHGREDLFEDVDLSRTVGWLTSLYPLRLEVRKAANPGEALKSVKEQLRRVPRRGIGYGLLRYLCAQEASLAPLGLASPPQIGFNYLGQVGQALDPDSPFTLALESSGPSHSSRAGRSYLIEVNGGIAAGKLQLEWTYSENLYRQDTIRELAQLYMEKLRALIAHCQSPQAGGHTPSDFPMAKLDQKKLDKVLAKIGKSKGRAPK